MHDLVVFKNIIIPAQGGERLMEYTVENAFYIAVIVSVLFGLAVIFAVKHGKF